VRQGPCLSSAWEQATIRADDLRSEERWPLFTPRATGLGVLSMTCLQLFVHQEDLGALNLYEAADGLQRQRTGSSTCRPPSPD
jgi:hypothetical protein